VVTISSVLWISSAFVSVDLRNRNPISVLFLHSIPLRYIPYVVPSGMLSYSKGVGNIQLPVLGKIRLPWTIDTFMHFSTNIYNEIGSKKKNVSFRVKCANTMDTIYQKNQALIYFRGAISHYYE